MPKVEGSFSTSAEPQFGHATEVATENINRSNRLPHCAHWNSNTGTGALPFRDQPPIYSSYTVLDSAVVPLRESLFAVLTRPTDEALWRLRADLLESGLPADSEVWPLLQDLRDYIDQLETTTSSRDFSRLASKLDISAISGVILERVAERGDGSERALRLVSGLLSEGLMALATRQHVRAWSAELGAIHRSAAWRLYDRLWRWTERRTPELAADRRRRLIDELLSPIRRDDVSDMDRSVLLGRLFQIIVLWTVAEEIGEIELDGGADRDADAAAAD